MNGARKGIRKIERTVTAEKMSGPEPYRVLADHRAKTAEFKAYRLIGKALMILSSFVAYLIVGGLFAAHGGLVALLFVLPVALFISAFWKSFPAFCRCPDCKKRMVQRRKEGRVSRTNPYFSEIGPTGNFLVCDRCKLYLFLGETRR